jgi:hypothetical protein
MPTSLIALQILLILLPGFSSAYIVQLLVTRRPQTDLERVIESLLYSFCIYVAYSAASHGHLPFHIVQDPIGKSDTILWETSSLTSLAAITFGFSLVVTAYYKHDGNSIFRLFDTELPAILRWFRWLKLTERTTRNSIWNDIFESEYIEGMFVQVELTDGRSLLGAVHYYSDVADDSSLYLAEAAWLPLDGEPVRIKGPGILLTKASGIRSISLLESKREQEPDAASTSSVSSDTQQDS